jgi:hypothetical protein
VFFGVFISIEMEDVLKEVPRNENLYRNVARKRIMAPMNNTVPMAAIARSCGQTTPIPASLKSTREQNSI